MRKDRDLSTTIRQLKGSLEAHRTEAQAHERATTSKKQQQRGGQKKDGKLGDCTSDEGNPNQTTSTGNDATAAPSAECIAEGVGVQVQIKQLLTLTHS